MNEKLNKITEFLNYFEKEYSIKAWESCQGWDIIIEEYDSDIDTNYKQVISLNENGYLTFEKQEVKE